MTFTLSPDLLLTLCANAVLVGVMYGVIRTEISALKEKAREGGSIEKDVIELKTLVRGLVDEQPKIIAATVQQTIETTLRFVRKTA